MISALISQVKGLAVFDDGEQLGILSVEKINNPRSGTEAECARIIHDAADLEVISVEDIDSLGKHLLLREDRENILQASLILLDKEHSLEIHSRAAEKLRDYAQNDQLAWVQAILLSTPLPIESDANGAAHHDTPLKEFFAQLSEVQGEVKTLEQAWLAIPEENFYNEEREILKVKVLRNYVFKNLIQGKSSTASSPFDPGLRCYAESLSRCKSVRSEDDKFASCFWLDVNGEYESQSKQLWEVAPWRSSWLASEWPRLRKNLAHELAHTWLFSIKTPSETPPEQVRKDISQTLYFRWVENRYKSRVSATVDLIGRLVRTGESLSSVSHIGQSGFRELYSAKVGPYFLSSERSKSSPSRYDDSDHFEKAVIEFFGIPTLAKDIHDHPTSAFDSTRPKLNKSWLHAKVNASSAQKLIDHQSPLRLSGELADFYNSDSPSNHRNELDAEELVEPLKLAIGLHSLDQVFEKDGGVMQILQIKAQADSPLENHAIFINFEKRHSQIYGGHLATVLDFLQKRLAADVRSGLPSERCGWIYDTDLAETLNEVSEVLASSIENLRRMTADAGFSTDTLQKNAVGVRLNPELVTFTSQQLLPKKLS